MGPCARSYIPFLSHFPKIRRNEYRPDTGMYLGRARRMETPISLLSSRPQLRRRSADRHLGEADAPTRRLVSRCPRFWDAERTG